MAVRCGADAIGLVSQMPSGPGVIEDGLIADIARSVPQDVATFLLTCRVDPGAIVEQVLSAGVNTVQLVDEAPSAAYDALRRHAPRVRIVQVLHVLDEDVLAQAARIEHLVDAILLDSGHPGAPVKELGGTGRTHDWALSARLVAATARPVFLAGGIRPSNVGEAIRTVRPYGIDLCSGVRTGGRLDEGALRELIGAMHKARV